MKILLVGPKSEFTDGVRRAFIGERHQVLYIDERGLRRFPPLWRLVRAVPLLRRAGNALLGSYIVWRAREFKPALVLMVKGTTVKERTLRKLKEMKILIANWFPENGLHEPYRSWLDSHIGLYDHFFCFDSALLERNNEHPNTRLTYLPLGVDPTTFQFGELTAVDHELYDCDICFVGAHYPEREKILSELVQWNVKIFGWSKWASSSLAHLYLGPLNAKETAKAFRCAKIVLNMNLEPPVKGVNAKTYEICAANAFQMTDWRDDLPKLFHEDRELVVFRTIAELKEKISDYLKNKPARDQIALAGYHRVLESHTMKHRVRTIVASLA